MALSKALRMPKGAIHAGASTSPDHVVANPKATGKVAMAAIPSRDSQLLRHCDRARHARSGLPRCAVDESKPAVIRTSARPTLVNAKSSDEALP